MLVRLHGEPVAGVRVELPPGGLAPQALAHEIWRAGAQRIRAHFQADGLTTPPGPDPDGWPAAGEEPRCSRERGRFLDRAPSMAVVVPSRERPDRLRRCVLSILACEYPRDRLQVVIADNAPQTPRTRELADELRSGSDARLDYVREDAPGSASARNRGLEAVQAEFVAMTDDDVVVDPRWLFEVARAFNRRPAAGAVSGLLWPAELRTPAQLWFEQYGGFSRGFEPRVFDLGENRPDNEPLYPWNAGLLGTGNNFAFRTAVLRDIGGFDPALGNGTPARGGVDSEVLLRMVLSGHQVVYEPRALAYHAHRPDFEDLRRQVYAYGVGQVAYYLKTILAERRFAWDFARKLPVGVRWMLSPDAHINRYKEGNYPRELIWLERRGMAYGPIGYARSRRRYGPHPVYGRRASAARR